MGYLQTSIKVEDYLEQIILFTGLAMLIFGILGIYMTVFSVIYADDIYQIEMAFIYSYMAIFGLLVTIYHKRIIVRGYRT